jgi:hypothetical protein
MKVNKVKFALFALTSGLVALSTAGCLMRWAGDAVGDWIWLRAID